jgi:hypothetical protein
MADSSAAVNKSTTQETTTSPAREITQIDLATKAHSRQPELERVKTNDLIGPDIDVPEGLPRADSQLRTHHCACNLCQARANTAGG